MVINVPLFDDVFELPEGEEGFSKGYRHLGGNAEGFGRPRGGSEALERYPEGSEAMGRQEDNWETGGGQQEDIGDSIRAKNGIDKGEGQ
jgi:hypothetical protein